MWKKRFLPYSLDDRMTPQPGQESKKSLADMQPVREDSQQQQLPPAAHQQSQSRVQLPNITPTPPRDPHWKQVPVIQQVVPAPTMMQTNPINHMHQQQFMHDMEMYRARQMYEMHHYLSLSGMYNMARAPMFPPTPIHTPEMIDEDTLQRYQHAMYLQQARDMQMADLQAEHLQKSQKMFSEPEKNGYGATIEKNVDIDRNKMARRNSYKAVMKNGELVKTENGHLMVTHDIMANNSDNPLTYAKDSPVDLSVKIHVPHSTDANSGYTSSPQHDQDTAITLLKLSTNVVYLVSKIVKAVQPQDEFLKEDAKDSSASTSPQEDSQDFDMKSLFPLLKATNTGSLVLWNFLWALLQDKNHEKIVTWISFEVLRFKIVSPSMMATMWGMVKQNPSMDWEKIKKILDLYLRKKLISSGPSQHEFTFLILPKAIKESHETTKK